MEAASVTLARLVIAAGALGLVGSLFMPWFELPVALPHDVGPVPALPDVDSERTAWQSFRVADVLLVLVAAGAGGGLAVALALDARWPYFGVAGLGWLGVCLTIYASYWPAGAVGLAGGRPHLGFLAALLSAGAITGAAFWAGLSRTPV